jgi:hypothetical protein
MADVAQDTQQEFWRSPTVLHPLTETALPAAVHSVSSSELADACADCGTEFMIGARFCHTCGLSRPALADAAQTTALSSLWDRSMTWSAARTRSGSASLVAAWRKISFPRWMQYLHFHEIQRGIGLPLGSLIAFMIGLGCVLGAIGVSLFYKASNLAEFQAIQMWRIEWLLAATAAFVAGILLKKPSRD